MTELLQHDSYFKSQSSVDLVMIKWGGLEAVQKLHDVIDKEEDEVSIHGYYYAGYGLMVTWGWRQRTIGPSIKWWGFKGVGIRAIERSIGGRAIDLTYSGTVVDLAEFYQHWMDHNSLPPRGRVCWEMPLFDQLQLARENTEYSLYRRKKFEVIDGQRFTIMVPLPRPQEGERMWS